MHTWLLDNNFIVYLWSFRDTGPMAEKKRETIREISYPKVPLSSKEKMPPHIPIHQLPDEKKYDYHYWDKFLKGHKRGFKRWQLLLIPLLIILISLVYRGKFKELDRPWPAGPKSKMKASH